MVRRATDLDRRGAAAVHGAFMPKLATLPAPLVFPLGSLAAILVFFAVSGSIWIAHLNNTRVQYFPEAFLENGWPPGHPRAGQGGAVIVDAS